MPRVFIPSPMRPLTDGHAEAVVEGSTVAQVIDNLDLIYPGIKDRLRKGDQLVPGLSVSIDDVMTRRGLMAPVRPESEVHFLPTIGGG